ncbi:unnamed protein product [Rotaria sp. Silwood1]|nr:unnamed protein product [Rotaria sp. Silwood1]CAF3423875.1 unnamed protein product [Rotaria sp. Silwood1]CAF3431749.1 unnamed protein product [Rotaria sp. Silwood1]CAF3436222.1 unnamed protein product [Rotaria sp. Silwood1]CAF4518260.1 unnamed protein product [Rotaria sp. Silwood1]
MTNSQSESNANTSEELLSNTLPARIGPYRSLSAKRPRDPSHRKSVSFNDVPIVHEVPLHDTMRNSNCDTYRSWAYTDATTPTSVIPSFYSSQVILPFNSTSAAAQKIHANRLSSTLYSTPPTTSTTNRIPDWAIRGKTSKSTSNSEEINTTNENHSTGNPPVIIVHIPDERTIKDTSVKTNTQSTLNNLYNTHSQTSSTPIPSSSHNLENGEEKKYPYRSAMVPDTDHYRSIPFNYGPLSDSTATYTSMLSTNLIQSNHSSTEQPITGHSRTARARSATLPGTANHSPTRANDTISITPFRATTANLLSNGSNSSTRAVLRPTTIAFQCSQPANTTMNTINGSSTVNTTSTTNNTNQSSTTITNTTKPPIVPSRFGTSAAAAAAAHSRFVIPTNRTLSTSSLNPSTIKYTFAHPTMDSTLTNTLTTQATMPKPPPTSYSRSRSAHVLSTRRSTASPVVMLDGQSNGGTTTNPTTNLYATAKRNPNVRQTYGSYYMHRVLLPTTIH